MLNMRTSNERGHADHGWLNSFHTFSFASYHDPKHMGFRSLRVINEDWIAPGQGFGMHPHQNMEIITYVVKGAIAHKDSLGTSEVLRPGEIQRMSAGSGIMHSEFNPSDSEPLHLLQIWIMPERKNITPSYEQKPVRIGAQNELVLIASPTGAHESVSINQDLNLYAAKLEPGARAEHTIQPGRAAWVQLISGTIEVNGSVLTAGDAVAIEDETLARIAVTKKAELLLFDLA